MTQLEPYSGEPDIGRLLTVPRGELTDCVPHFEVLIEDEHVEQILGRKAGNTLGIGGEKGTPEDVQRDAEEHMDVMKPGGRWIAGSSHRIGDYIPQENFVAMIKSFHKYGVY